MLRWLKRLFGLKPSPAPARTKPNARLRDRDGNVTIATQAQLDKRTDFKIGESYRLGEMIVTLRASKEEVKQVIAYWDKKREEKAKRLKERAIEIMLMNPKELLKLQLDEWLAKREGKTSRILSIMGTVSEAVLNSKYLPTIMRKRYIPPVDQVPSGMLKERFKELTKDLETQEEVNLGRYNPTTGQYETKR